MEKICTDCTEPFVQKPNQKYKRKFPDKCPLCALINTPNKSYSNPTHGHRSNGKREKLYVKWVQMNMSCNSEKCKDYKYVGAKGIKICKGWKTYEGFRRWALSKNYKDGMIFKRINLTEDYTPTNCKFLATRANKLYTHNGFHYTAEQLKKTLGSKVPLKTIKRRLERKWDVPSAFLQPSDIRIRRSKKVSVVTLD